MIKKIMIVFIIILIWSWVVYLYVDFKNTNSILEKENINFSTWSIDNGEQIDNKEQKQKNLNSKYNSVWENWWWNTF
jgi:hypothetical protein